MAVKALVKALTKIYSVSSYSTYNAGLGALRCRETFFQLCCGGIAFRLPVLSD